jgi:hypothetical protein
MGCCKCPANRENAGNPRILRSPLEREGPNMQNPVGRGKNIAHTAKLFPLWFEISNQKSTSPEQGQFLLIFALDRTSHPARTSGRPCE